MSAPTNWLLKIYDATGKLVDVPQSDVQDFTIQRQVSGGPGQATFTFKRPFNQIGALGFNYSFLFWMWSYGTTMPTNPTWAGYQCDPQQVQKYQSGQVVVTCFGDMTRLDDAVVTAEVNPGVTSAGYTNPNLDAAERNSSLRGSVRRRFRRRWAT
jgi:hypothetical protein